MPVWQGQGYNSGVRDSTNLAWKLTAILRGIADDALLDTYDTERRDHAKAMIDVSVAMGRILSPTNKAVAGTRDKLAAALNLVPAAKKWIAEGRYKPQPRFHVGALVEAAGPAATGQPVGSMFPQPHVDTRTERNVLLDDVLGPWFSVLVWGNDPRHVFNHTHPVGFVIIRPDRYVAAAALAQHAPSVTQSLATAIHLTPGDHHVARPRIDVAQPVVGALAAAS